MRAGLPVNAAQVVARLILAHAAQPGRVFKYPPGGRQRAVGEARWQPKPHQRDDPRVNSQELLCTIAAVRVAEPKKIAHHEPQRAQRVIAAPRAVQLVVDGDFFARTQ